MAPRTFWKGYLKLSLVTCPVTMLPATSEANKVRFHTLNARTGNRIRSEYVDAETGDPVDEDDRVKGYETGDDQYVLLEDEELESVALESTRTIDVDMFVPNDSIEWLWYDKPHYLMPSDAIGEEAFAVIRTAMEEAGMVGISRLVLYRRERAVMLKPRDRGIVLWTLRYGDEVRDPDAYFGGIKPAKVESDLLSLASRLIEDRSASWDPKMVSDPVQENLLDIIKAKQKGRRKTRPKKEKAEESSSNVVNIMDALRKSLASETKPSKRAKR